MKRYFVQVWEIVDERYNSWYYLNHTTINCILPKPVLCLLTFFSGCQNQCQLGSVDHLIPVLYIILNECLFFLRPWRFPFQCKHFTSLGDPKNVCFYDLNWSYLRGNKIYGVIKKVFLKFCSPLASPTTTPFKLHVLIVSVCTIWMTS